MAILYVASETSELEPFANMLTGLRKLKWPLDTPSKASSRAAASCSLLMVAVLSWPRVPSKSPFAQ